MKEQSDASCREARLDAAKRLSERKNNGELSADEFRRQLHTISRPLETREVKDNQMTTYSQDQLDDAVDAAIRNEREKARANKARRSTEFATSDNFRGGSYEKTKADREFSQYLRTGHVGKTMRLTAGGADTRAELDSASMQTLPGQGGYMIPQGFWANLQVALKQYGGTSEHFRLVRTPTGTEMPWPTTNPTGVVGQYITEANQVGFTDYVFGQGILYAWTITSGVVLASMQLCQDSAFDVDSFVAERVGESIGRKIAAESISGAGSASKALTGIVTSINAYGQTTTQPSGGYYALGAATQVKTFANPSGASELSQNVLAPATCLSLVSSVDPAYWPNSAWYMSPTQALNMRGVIDSNGRPLLNWETGFEEGAIGEILGFPVLH